MLLPKNIPFLILTTIFIISSSCAKRERKKSPKKTANNEQVNKSTKQEVSSKPSPKTHTNSGSPPILVGSLPKASLPQTPSLSSSEPQLKTEVVRIQMKLIKTSPGDNLLSAAVKFKTNDPVTKLEYQYLEKELSVDIQADNKLTQQWVVPLQITFNWHQKTCSSGRRELSTSLEKISEMDVTCK